MSKFVWFQKLKYLYFPSNSRISTSNILRHEPVVDKNQSELELENILRKRFPNAGEICVKDVSGGCGAMFEVHVSCPEFAGNSVVKQHRMVTETLKAKIKDMHGIRISTQV